jgi:YqxM protein
MAYTHLTSSLKRTKREYHLEEVRDIRGKVPNIVINKIRKELFSLVMQDKGGRTIRSSRVKKFRNIYKKYLLGIKVLLIWYFFIIAALQINSFTNASFNDVEELQASLHVSWPVDEWDKSSLDFDPSSKTLERGGTCSPTPFVYAEIFNDGEDMTFSTWTWELFKVKKGKNPISGVLDSGEVETIKAQQIGIIQTSSQLQNLDGNGTYRFKVTKPDRPGNDAIWSEPIEIKDCDDRQRPNQEQTQNTTKTEESSTKLEENKESGDTEEKESIVEPDNTADEETITEPNSSEEEKNTADLEDTKDKEEISEPDKTEEQESQKAPETNQQKDPTAGDESSVEKATIDSKTQKAVTGE